MDQESVRAAVYEYIRRALSDAARNQPSSYITEQTLRTVRSAVQDACADFAETWNSESVGAVAEQLPTEVLVMCFRAAPFEDRVSASHVSRKWRAIALSEHSLWATFRRTGRVDPSSRDDDKLLSQLAAMLDRSRPFPFTLQLPSPSRGYRSYAERIATLLKPDFARMRDFDGPLDLYKRLNPTALPHLKFLRLVTEKYRGSQDTFEVPRDWAVHGAPLSRLELHAPNFIVSPNCIPSTTLTHVCFSPTDDSYYVHLFRWCPNVSSLELRGLVDSSALPLAPVPPSLTMVALSGPENGAVEFGGPLSAWAGYPIRQLTVHGAASLDRPLNVFLASYSGPVKIDILRNVVEITESSPSSAAWRCVVYPYSWARTNHLVALRGDCASRLTSISVPLDRFGAFFSAQLDAPVLRRVQFNMHTDWSAMGIPPHLPSPAFHLSAPQLQEMILEILDNRIHMLEDILCAPAVDALRLNLRGLIAFNAPLLDKITVRGSRSVITILSCAGLAQYSQSYVEIADP
ncbi:hypothetical protein AURDEDRAFT_170322 [Auricularia subglabra TFB-10046 SS5]|nr:hypothetical protein AURDEDRAFT_170322 [Auricularia subglabra TFB-10046 SS5]